MIQGAVTIVFNNFPDIAANMEPEAGKAVEESARVIEGDARAAAPRDTGALQSSIRAASVGPLTWKVEAPVPYAGFVEYGTGRGPAQPYMTPAAENEAPELPGRIANRIVGSGP